MTTLTFVEIYPQNNKGNRLIIDKAEFTDGNRALDCVFYYIQHHKKLKKSYFVGIEWDEKTDARFSLLRDEYDVIQEEGRQEVKKFLTDKINQ